MASLKKAKHAKANDKKRRRSLDLAPPFGKREQQTERQQHHKDCEQMPDRQRIERQKQRAWAFFHEPRGDRERPPHSRIDSVIEAARNECQQKQSICPT